MKEMNEKDSGSKKQAMHPRRCIRQISPHAIAIQKTLPDYDSPMVYLILQNFVESKSEIGKTTTFRLAPPVVRALINQSR